MRWAWLLLALTACGRAEGVPGWVQVIPGVDRGALAVAYQSDVIMSVIYLDEGVVKLGQLDLEDDGRQLSIQALDDIPELAHLTGSEEPLRAAHVDLVKRPLGGERWGFLDGVVVRFSLSGDFQQILDLRTGVSRQRGALALSPEADVLHVGGDGIGYRRWQLDSDGFTVEDITPTITWTRLGGERTTDPLPPVCQLADVGDRLYLHFCDRGGVQSPTGILVGDTLLLPEEVAPGGFAMPQEGALATAGDHMLSVRNGFGCLHPVDEEGAMSLPDTDDRADDLCVTADYLGPWAERAAVSPAADSFALAFDGGPALVVESRPPPDTELDLDGTWCRLSGDLDLQQLDFDPDGSARAVLAPTAPGLETAFADVQWTRQGPDHVEITWREGDPDLVSGDVVTRHIAHRVGDTLLLRIDPELDPELGFVDPTGLWTRSDEPTCRFTYPLLPAR